LVIEALKTWNIKVHEKWVTSIQHRITVLAKYKHLMMAS
jgi:hypothetical protein